jgi:hypothetical protein
MLGWTAWLRARFGLAAAARPATTAPLPDPRPAIIAALRLDESPLRAAYARVGHLTVADMRDRLAEPGDHERLAWPRFEDYRAAVLRTCAAVGERDLRLLHGQGGECAWRIAGLDFAEVITRAQGGAIREVEFVGFVRDGTADRPGAIVRLS